MPNKALTIEILANTKKAVEEIERLKSEIENFSQKVRSQNSDLQSHQKALSGIVSQVKALVAAYAGFSAIKGAVTTVADFEQSIAKLGAISGATKGELEAMEQKAKELGASTMFSASQVGEAMNYLAMAGYKTKDILASIGDVLNLAAVGGTDLAQAADIASNILSGFGLKAEETARVVDVMTAAITNANTNIPELGEAMKYVAPNARALGVSLEETAAAIGVLSNAGIKATMAGTGLSTMLVRLASPTEAAKEAIRALGITLYDSNGKFVGLTNVLGQFATKLKGLSDEAKARYLKDIFGIETLKTAQTLIASVGGEYDALFSKIANSSGMASQKVKQMTDTFWGHFKELQSALEALVIAIGEDLLPALTDLVRWLTGAAQGAKEFYEENRVLIQTVTEISALFFGLSKLRSVIVGVLGAKAAAEVVVLVKGLKNLKSAIVAAALAFKTLERSTIILGALSGALAAVDWAINSYAQKIEKTTQAAQSLNEATEQSRKIFEKLQKAMVIENGHKSFRLTAQEINSLKKEIKALINANNRRIAQMVKEGELSKEQERIVAALRKKNELLLRAYERLAKTKPYEGAKQSANEAAQAVQRLTKEDEKYLASLKRTYQSRINQHKAMLERLYANEKAILERIAAEHRRYAQQIAAIERAKVAEIEGIERSIENLKIAGLKKEQQYTAKITQAQRDLAKAKEAIRKGDLQSARRYMQSYKSLVSEIASFEVKEGKRVIVSKEQARKQAMAMYAQLKGVVADYYATEKAQAARAHRQKLAQLKAQLQATRAQIALQQQRLELERQLVQALTGQKIKIDNRQALSAIKALDAEIKKIDEQIELAADTKKADQKIHQVDGKIKKKRSITVGADTNEAKRRLRELTRPKKVRIGADTTTASQKLADLKRHISSLRPKLHIITNVDEVLAAIRRIPRRIETVHVIRTVQRRASGGAIGFERISNKVPGYDPLDSDDVPALLTRGEFVINRSAVEHYGEGLFWALNFKSLPKEALPRFATGGIVEVGRLDVNRLQDNGGNVSYSGDDLDIPQMDRYAIKELKELMRDIDDLARSLKTNPFAKEIQEARSAVRKYEQRFSDLHEYSSGLASETRSIEEDQLRLERFRRSVNGRELSAEEFERHQAKVKELTENISLRIEAFKRRVANLKKDKDSLEEEIEAFKSDFLDRLRRKIERYIESVDEIKQKIADRLGEFGMKMDFEVEESTDLKRLKRYYKRLASIELVTEDEVKDAVQEYLRSAFGAMRSAYYDQMNAYGGLTSWNAKTMRLAKPTDFRLAQDLAMKFGVQKMALYSKMPKLHLERLDFRNFGLHILDDATAQRIASVINRLKIPKFRFGGRVPGFGGGDRNLALLEDGEFVMRKEAVAHFGERFFEELNSLRLPKFRFGGSVGKVGDFSKKEPQVRIDFRMPSGKSYEMMSSRDIAKALASEFRRLY